MQLKTPGVYIVEQDAFPNTVIEVATAIPVFLGYTEKAVDGAVPKAGIPTCIGSLLDYVRIFGGPPVPRFSLAPSVGQETLTAALAQQFFLYHGVKLYFMNGGGPAYVLSVGTFASVKANGIQASDFMPEPDPAIDREAPFDALEKVSEVTLIVAPDSTLLDSADDCYRFWQAALQHCSTMQSRMALIDIRGGGTKRSHDPDGDVISGKNDGFREKIGSNFLNYGAAYYPWLNFDVVDAGSISYDNLTDAGLAVLADALMAELAAMKPQPSVQMQVRMSTLYAAIRQRLPADAAPLPAGTESRTAVIARGHQQLMQVSPLYQRVAADMLTLANQLPPACAMAGVYAQTDANRGVWMAPANTSIVGAVSPMVDISQDEQEDLNMPLDGRAVNAIRTIPTRGLVVWGARTLDGNSDDWRYINVRRTLLMMEQSIKNAMLAYIFAPNVATTWVAVQNMISTFLINLWAQGALAGAKAQDAFSVQVGLNSTMSSDDILNGYMRVSVRVALVHPDEFIVLTFQQQQPVS